MLILPCCREICAIAMFLLAMSISAPAQQFTKLVDFNGSNGINPAYNSITQGADGNFYGTADVGGANNYGTVFKMRPDGTLFVLLNFDSFDGSFPESGVILGMDGNLYGTTYLGGITTNWGTAYRISPAGTLRSLSLCTQAKCSTGVEPVAGLMQADDGTFYGTTQYGGTNNYGTIFSITCTGLLTTIHSFDGLDGFQPIAPLTEGTDGALYGTTSQGGAHASGTVFRMTADGTLTTLHDFNGPDGCGPRAGLIQAADGNFYGATWCSTNGAGSVFRMSPDGTLVTLHTFHKTDGADPYGTLIVGTDGNFYGTTGYGGAYNWGTAFRMTPEGTVTTIHDFNSSDGALPIDGLIQATSGDFYGTTDLGGASNYGTIFRLSMGLGPFVTFVRAAGRVGQTGGILGQGFIGTTAVSLNGIPVPFTVKSDTFILATVPAGATTGYVTVTTPVGTLTSNKPFYVIP